MSEIEPGERNQWDRWLAGETGPLEEWVAKIAAYVPPRKPSKKRSKKAAAA